MGAHRPSSRTVATSTSPAGTNKWPEPSRTNYTNELLSANHFHSGDLSLISSPRRAGHVWPANCGQPDNRRPRLRHPKGCRLPGRRLRAVKHTVGRPERTDNDDDDEHGQRNRQTTSAFERQIWPILKCKSRITTTTMTFVSVTQQQQQ